MVLSALNDLSRSVLTTTGIPILQLEKKVQRIQEACLGLHSSNPGSLVLEPTLVSMKLYG